MSVSVIRRFVVFGVFALMLSTATVSAAPVKGTVEEVSVDDNTVIVKPPGKNNDEPITITLDSKVVITIDGKKGKLEDIVQGQSIIAVINPSSEMATKLTVTTPKTSTTKKSVPKKPTEEDSSEMMESDDAATKPIGKVPKMSITKKPNPKKSMRDDTPEVTEADFWPQYRGPNRDNISPETGLLDQWPADGPKLAWQQKGLGEGYSSVSIAHGKLFTMGNQGDDEMVVAMDLATGKPIWSAKTGGKSYRDGGQGNGPRGTPTIDDDRVYALGANGDLVCLGEAKGEVIWQKNILSEYEGNNIVWGISESVLIDGKNLICSPGGKQGTMVAIDKMTGRPVWQAMVDDSPPAAYSSPILVEFQGERMYVNYVHTAVIAVRAKDGNILWGFRESANGTANCSTPLYSDGQVFTSSGYDTGAAMFKLLKGGKAKPAYASKEMQNHHGGMVLLDGHVYGFDRDVLKCIDLKNGKTLWKDRSVGKGSLTYADGHLYLRGENGKVALCLASPKQYEEHGRFEPPIRSDRSAWSHPVVCAGKLFLRDMDSIAVYDVKKP